MLQMLNARYVDWHQLTGGYEPLPCRDCWHLVTAEIKRDQPTRPRPPCRLGEHCLEGWLTVRRSDPLCYWYRKGDAAGTHPWTRALLILSKVNSCNGSIHVMDHSLKTVLSNQWHGMLMVSFTNQSVQRLCLFRAGFVLLCGIATSCCVDAHVNKLILLILQILLTLLTLLCIERIHLFKMLKCALHHTPCCRPCVWW